MFCNWVSFKANSGKTMRKLTFAFVTFGSDIFWTAIGSRWSRCKFHDTITPADFSNSRTGQLISILTWMMKYPLQHFVENWNPSMSTVIHWWFRNISVLKLWVFWSSQHWYHRYTQGGGGGRVNIGPPQANFKTLVNKNVIKVKPEIGGPQAIFLKAWNP
jgi:hypothetical protein